MKMSKMLYVANRRDWRAWLKKHHKKEKEVWLIYYKKQTGRPRIPYEDAVEEALCFGWIDSLVQRIDHKKYAQKFTPRKTNSAWSALNKKRIATLIREGKMTQAGLAMISFSVAAAAGTKQKPKSKNVAIPQEIRRALASNLKASEYFNHLAPSYRRNYIGWIISAKKRETRQRRMKEAIELLTNNRKLGLK